MNSVSSTRVVPHIRTGHTTAAKRRNAVPQFVYFYLAETLRRNPHYEHELYPPFAAYLHYIFPPARGFIVAPQGIARPTVPPGTRRQSLGTNLSFTALGGVHPGRGTGHEPGKLYPDLTISKFVVDRNTGIMTQRMITIIELKRQGEQFGPAKTQLCQYMELYRDQNYHRGIASYLLFGPFCYCVSFGSGGGTSTVSHGSILVGGGGAGADPLTRGLTELSSQYWHSAAL